MCYPYLHTAVLGTGHSWSCCIHRTAHSKRGWAFCCSYDKHTSHKHTLLVRCTLLIHYHGDKGTSQPLCPTLLDHTHTTSRLSPLYTCNTETNTCRLIPSWITWNLACWQNLCYQATLPTCMRHIPECRFHGYMMDCVGPCPFDMSSCIWGLAGLQPLHYSLGA